MLFRSVAVTRLELDWFYLAVYALLQRWTASEVWYLVGAVTFLALLAPWLPPKRVRKDAFHMMIHPDNRIVAVRDGEVALDAALREDVRVPFDCRSGGCGMCKATLLQGEVDYGLYQKAFLSDEERAQGRVLLCSCTPLSDIEIEYVPVEAPGKIPARVYAARVVKMNRLSHDVMQVFLKCVGEETPLFYAGQYIDVLLPDGDKRSFSFATAPHERELIELQIRLIPGGKFTTHVFNEMRVGDTVRFEGPLGSFFLREDTSKPIIFVAGATGFAPVKSMVEHALKTGLRRKMYLYWGVRSLRDLYMPDLPRQWERQSANFKFVPVLSEPKPEDHWQGRTGLVHEAILADFPDLRDHQIYACGSAAMVQAVRPAFMARGMSEHDCFSDAFRLTPRMSSESADMVRLGGTA